VQRPGRTQPARTVQNAVRLMYLGAALQVLFLIVTVLTRNRFRSVGEQCDGGSAQAVPGGPVSG
jgi:hypothetical protein